MGERKSIRNWRPVRVVLDLWEFAGFIVLLFPLIRGPLAPPDMSVVYRIIRLAEPRPVAEMVAQSEGILIPTALGSADDVAHSSQLLEITIENNTSRQIHNLDLRVRGVHSIRAVGLRTLATALNRKIDSVLVCELTNHTLTFPNLTDLPPHATAIVQVWGSMLEPQFAVPVAATADVGRSRVRSMREATPLAKYVGDNFWIILFLAGVSTLLIGLRRLAVRRNSPPATDAADTAVPESS